MNHCTVHQNNWYTTILGQQGLTIPYTWIQISQYIYIALLHLHNYFYFYVCPTLVFIMAIIRRTLSFYHINSSRCLINLHLQLESVCKVVLWSIPTMKQKYWLIYWLIRGRCEGGHLGSAEKFKTPFFKRYFEILSRSYSNGSKTSLFFFFFKYFNKYGR